MIVLRWIWWFAGVGFTLICAFHTIAYAGWGLSIWEYKPEPSAFLLTLAFLGAALLSFDGDIENFPGKAAHSGNPNSGVTG